MKKDKIPGLKSMVRTPNPEKLVKVEKVVVKKMVAKVVKVVVVETVVMEVVEEVMKVVMVVEQEELLVETVKMVKQIKDQNHVTKVDQEKEQSLVENVTEVTDKKKELKKNSKKGKVPPAEAMPDADADGSDSRIMQLGAKQDELRRLDHAAALARSEASQSQVRGDVDSVFWRYVRRAKQLQSQCSMLREEVSHMELQCG